MKIQAFEKSDIEKIGNIQPDGWPNIKEVFEYYIKSRFCSPVKVEDSGEIIGVGAAISFVNTGWLAHIIVSPKHRNKGIGGEIVDGLCIQLDSAGHKTISLIATDLGYPVYKKAGFVEQTQYAFWEKDAKSNFEISNSISMISEGDIESISKIDRGISGEDRRNLFISNINNGYIYRQNNDILGFYLKELGDGVVIAENDEAGIELLKLRCMHLQRGIFPTENKCCIQFCKQNGYEEKMTARRMVRGKVFNWKPERVYNRIGGNVG